MLWLSMCWARLPAKDNPKVANGDYGVWFTRQGKRKRVPLTGWLEMPRALTLPLFGLSIAEALVTPLL
jgi:hypothetical protein